MMLSRVRYKANNTTTILKASICKYSTLNNVTVVDNIAHAKQIVEHLTHISQDDNIVHACDTETTGVNPVKETPVGNGQVICASIYSGPQFNFGTGSKIWIDNLKEPGTLDVFKPFFESEKIKKVWHNYSFDRHVLMNHCIQCNGLYGDTLMMGRLRYCGHQYRFGLASLSEQLLKEPKRDMNSRFAVPKLTKSGKPSKIKVVPPTVDLQLNSNTRNEWIDYSVEDARVTWDLFQYLRQELAMQPLVTSMHSQRNMIPWFGSQEAKHHIQTLWDFYQAYYTKFSTLLIDIERTGMYLDREFLAASEIEAETQKLRHEKIFLNWANATGIKGMDEINWDSNAQLTHYLFAPYRDKGGKIVPKLGSFTSENLRGQHKSSTGRVLKKGPKFELGGLELNVQPFRDSPNVNPNISSSTFDKLVGDMHADPPKPGLLVKSKKLEHFSDDFRLAGCVAFDNFRRKRAITKLLNTYIQPLLNLTKRDKRVHSSLNVATDTGRLNSRNPNLQNLPAMEKDIFMTRRAFAAEDNNALIVADYGQLELRLLAHMSNCKSMLNAFEAGGDFHSRTAASMFPHIKEDIKQGTVLLESASDSCTLPLVKDKYASERRKAKTLNFSIAYGKTAHGLAKDWGTNLQDAQNTVDLWYNDRPEVRQWQNTVIDMCKEVGYVQTMMGRRRYIPKIIEPRFYGAATRAAINTPIQGGAADVVMCAMINLWQNQRLRQLNFHLIMQIHDEIIMEGPKEHADEALQLVKSCMENPFQEKLLVDLTVDAKIGRTWYETK